VKEFVWTTCLFFLSLALSSQNPSAPNPEPRDDEYTIYSEVIQTEFGKEGVERIVIGDHTLMGLPPVMMGMTQFGSSANMQKIRDTAAKETLQDYDQKNKSSIPLDSKFSLRVPLVLMSEAERDRIFQVKGKGEKRSGNPKGFEEFYRLYPKSPGFVTLSRVGFDAVRTQALVYVGYLCGGLCGDGKFFLLVKEGGVWKIQHVAMTWIS
jgi:hypothetical protein